MNFQVSSETLKAQKQKITAINQLNSSIKRNGYVVTQVLLTEECEEYIKMLKKWLKKLDSRIDLSNPTQEYFPDNIHGIIKAYGIGHTTFMNKIRQNNKIKNIFAILNKCQPSDLIHTYDGACYYPWQLSNMTSSFKLWPHRDQNPTNNNHMTYQSLVNLQRNDLNGDGGLVVWPKSHKLKFDNELCNTDFFKIPYPTAEISNDKAVRLIVPQGAMVIWDSRLIHCNVIPLHPSTHNRVVLYVCMVDKTRVSSSFKKLLKLCKKQKMSTSHNPMNFTINEEQVKYTNSKILPTNCHVFCPKLSHQ